MRCQVLGFVCLPPFFPRRLAAVRGLHVRRARRALRLMHLRALSHVIRRSTVVPLRMPLWHESLGAGPQPQGHKGNKWL